MSDLYEQIVSDRGSLQNWIERIPGLRGYIDRGDRRMADRMLREYISEQLQQRLSRFTSLEKQILNQGGLKMMSQTNAAKTRFQTYIDRVKTAAPGYSGFFAAVKVDEDALERLYAFDEAQVRYVARFDELLDGLNSAITAGEGIEAQIQAVYDLAQEALQAFSLREDVLVQLDKQYSAG